MRPKEILGVVDEVAGTRMFKEHNDRANKTMRRDYVAARQGNNPNPGHPPYRASRLHAIPKGQRRD